MRGNRIASAVCGLSVLAAIPFLHSCNRQANPMDGHESMASERSIGNGAPAGAAERRVLQSPLAGAWYSRDRAVLEREIADYLAAAATDRMDSVCALILPHAGYRWSGTTAAYGAKQLTDRRIQRVVVVGPSHRLPLSNAATVPDVTHIATPFGEIPLDQAFLRELKEEGPLFRTLPSAHEQEHSVQIQFPLLQRVLGEFQLVPIVVGQLDLPTTREIARVLRKHIDSHTLVIASSDFTHFGENFDYFPFRSDVAENLKKLDLGAVKRIEEKDLEGFDKYVRDTGATICGRYAIGVLLAMLPADAKAQLLHYDTSGHLSGDYSSSVSYACIAFTGRWPERAAAAARPDSSALSDADRRALLQLARGTLSRRVKTGQMPTVEELKIEPSPAMLRDCGAFVTLHKQGQLRGCVGEILPSRSLYKAVMHQAVNAGLNDTRFSPVVESEIPELKFDISVLTPPVAVASAKDIVIGRHGVILAKHGRSAVFLPQVAKEQGWGLEETLNHLARKAGLPESAWREGASFSVFEAIVFGEDDE